MNRQLDISAVRDQILRDGGILFAQPPSASPLLSWTPVNAADCADEATLMLNLPDSTGDLRIAFRFPPPTLLNASEPTNIVYRVKGLMEAQAKAINDIGGSRKIMDRCRAIKQSATAIQFEKYHCHVFADNLELVDSSLPEIVADLVKTHYFEQILMPRPSKKSGGFREADRLSAAVEMMSRKPPYCEKARKNFCEVKIKRFLRACALGMMPSDVWDGREDASGGYIIVLPDGRLLAFYVYNRNLFEECLFETTIFERASTTRHKYLTLVPDGDTGDYLLKLNLQIRFNR